MQIEGGQGCPGSTPWHALQPRGLPGHATCTADPGLFANPPVMDDGRLLTAVRIDTSVGVPRSARAGRHTVSDLAVMLVILFVMTLVMFVLAALLSSQCFLPTPARWRPLTR